ncbi:hypothetical protein [Lacihabitans soyangensis]|uniref:Uncharacterized protein n=1 Tax=Lacihabitans soyangensis TaxID=869394 RepID=A0AAE3H5S9_9BACT|nr:hypothetical protein [Lacihabitans soyangensis]MCP9765724.1 hypothetical protein [Lacihabitans soyangensis]
MPSKPFVNAVKKFGYGINIELWYIVSSFRSEDRFSLVLSLKTKHSWSDVLYNKNAKKYGVGIFLPDNKIEGLTTKDGFTTDNQTSDEANKNNTWVNNKGVLYASDVENFDQKELINYLMGNFVNGTGPENIIFPTNGAASLKLKNSGIANEAITQLLDKNIDFVELQVSGNFHAPSSIARNGFLAIETFIGSASVSVSRTTGGNLYVKIFNVTSLTSGDAEKHWWWNNYSNSVVRSNDGNNKYGNISQTFSFTIKDPNTY